LQGNERTIYLKEFWHRSITKSIKNTANAVPDSTPKPNVTPLDKLIMTPKFINNFGSLCIVVSLEPMVI
jgi:hypothetical protein